MESSQADPGGSSPGRPCARPQSSPDSLDGGPSPGESLPAFRRRVADYLVKIAKEEEKLVMMRKSYRKFKYSYDRLWSYKRLGVNPELKSREEALQKQVELVRSLKQRSGAFREKFANEERFCKMQQPAVVDVPGQASQPLSGSKEQQAAISAPATTPLLSEVSAPLTPQQSGDVSPEPSTSGILTFIEELESSLAGRKFCFSMDSCDESGDDDDVSPGPPKVLKKEKSRYVVVSSAAPVEEAQQEKGTVSAGEQAPAICMDTSKETTVSMDVSALAGQPDHQASLAGQPEHQTSLAETSVIRKDNVPANCNVLLDPLLQSVWGVAEGPSRNVTANVTTAGSNTLSYAGVVNKPKQRAPQVQAGRGDGFVAATGRRNVVQLRWEGEGPPPARKAVIEKILAMGFKAEEIFAFICPVGSLEYDLSFVRQETLDLFWERYEGSCRGQPGWRGMVPRMVSRQSLLKNVTILVRNESLPERDILVWMRRFGEMMSPMSKILDEHGIWTGGRSLLFRLKVVDNVVQHLPSSAFIGRDRLTVFYPGQPKCCNKCGEKGHFASSCSALKCSLCQGLGHVAKDCNLIRCNLCNVIGHAYSRCPEALHNYPCLDEELSRLDMEDLRGSVHGAPVPLPGAPVALPGAPGVSVALPDAPGVSAPLPDTPGASLPVPDAPGASVAVPDAHGVSVVVPDVSVPEVPSAADVPGVSSARQDVPVPLPRRLRSATAGLGSGVKGKAEGGGRVKGKVEGGGGVKGKVEGGGAMKGKAESGSGVKGKAESGGGVKGKAEGGRGKGKAKGSGVKGKAEGPSQGGGGTGDGPLPEGFTEEDMEWLVEKRKVGKRRKKIATAEQIAVENRFDVFSEIEDGALSDISVSSMEEEPSGDLSKCSKGGQATKHLPKSS